MITAPRQTIHDAVTAWIIDNPQPRSTDVISGIGRSLWAMNAQALRQTHEGTDMMTAAEIAALSNDDALAAFQNLAADIYKTERWQAAFSRDTDTALRSISYWTSGSRRVPTWAILLLDAKAHAREVLSALQMVTTGLKLASDLSDTI